MNIINRVRLAGNAEKRIEPLLIPYIMHSPNNDARFPKNSHILAYHENFEKNQLFSTIAEESINTL